MMEKSGVPADKGQLATSFSDLRIGELLVEMGRLSTDDLARILEYQRNNSASFGEAGRALGVLSERDISAALSRQFGYDVDIYENEGSRYSDELVCATNPFSARAEEFRGLRSQLMLEWFDKGKRALVVTAPDRMAGCSFIVANLALSMAQLGLRTLVLDANLRNPRQHRIFGLDASPGLSDVIVGRAGVQEAVKPSGFSLLRVMPAGTVPPNPQELLAAPAFADILATASRENDVVLLDAPAAAAARDVQVLTWRTGGALVIARKNLTRYNSFQQMCRVIRSSGARIVGSVFSEF